jgi:hypothetical protein
MKPFAYYVVLILHQTWMQLLLGWSVNAVRRNCPNYPQMFISKKLFETVKREIVLL